MSKHSKYNNFTSQINSTQEKDESLVTDSTSSLESTTVDPVKIPEPEPVIPTSSTGSTYTKILDSNKKNTSVDADITTFHTLKDNFLSFCTTIQSKKDKEKSAFALLRLAQFVLNKDKRTLYDETYKFIKDNRNTNLNPMTVFAGGEGKMKRSEIGVLTLFIAAFCRVQDGDGVDFKELERSLPGHPLLITYLTEKVDRKTK
jgi:hypothetical protein